MPEGHRAVSEGAGQGRARARFLAADVVFVGIAIIAALAFGFTLLMRLAERRLVPWRGRG